MERIDYLLNYLIKEYGHSIDVPKDKQEKFNLFRSLVNIRPAVPINENFLQIQDEYLKELTANKGITDISSLKEIKDNIYLWKGDITTLKCDAIVNAANSKMLGCFAPCHGCIDNAIHTFSGIQLRMQCNDIMKNQGNDEPTGEAKITDGFNLPCNKIIHTVGPIVSGKLTDNHCKMLKSCYTSCLNAAIKNNLDSIAFSCISTGEFHFPNEKAAEIAVSVVENFTKHNNIKIIFNVFKDIDFEIYKKLLKGSHESC